MQPKTPASAGSVPLRLGLRITWMQPLRPGVLRPLPLLRWHVCASFPNPAADYAEDALDLNDLLVKNPPATFMMRVSGRSMEDLGIHDGDLLIVDRSVDARTGDVVIAYLDGELTVKQLGTCRGRPVLLPASDAYPMIRIDPGQDFQVWGVVQHVIHTLKRRPRTRSEPR